MSDPRAVASRDSIVGPYGTYTIDASTILYDSTKSGGSAGVGLAVGVLAGGIVELVSDGEDIIGMLVNVGADGFCTVQERGHCFLPGGASATLTEGTLAVGALGAASAKGYIRSAASGTAAELAKSGPIIIDNTTATAVEVNFR